MKKIVLSILLVLVFSCPLFALDLSVYDVEIKQSSAGSYYFSLALASTDELFMFILAESGIAGWSCVGDYFASNTSYAFFPISYTISEENMIGDVLYDYPILFFQDSGETPKLNHYDMLDYHLVDFLTAILNDGFVLFDVLNLDTEDDEADRYYFNIPNKEEREEALNLFNRYINYFY